MIKIQINNIDEVLERHYNAIHAESYNRIIFLIDLFSVILNKKSLDSKVSSLQKYYNLNSSTIVAIAKTIAPKKNRNKLNYSSLTGYLKRQNQSLIPSNRRKREFEACLFALNYIEPRLKEIISSKPDRLLELHADFEKLYEKKYFIKVKSALTHIFPFENLSKGGFNKAGYNWNNYKLTQNIGVNVCPYCNRSWVNTIIKGVRKEKVVNPQLDHFFSKELHPLLRLSFFNLIPSCEPCNARLKHRIEFDDTYLHPYVEEYGNEAKYRSLALNYESAIGLGVDYNIEIEYDKTITNTLKNKIRKNHRVFEIKKVYEAHGDIVSEIFRKNHISNGKYLEILATQFPSLKSNPAELYRIAFGNYYDQKDFNKRPFSKLSKDVVKQLGIL